MGGDRLSCRDCGGSLPPRARFCSGCGLPVDAGIDHGLGVSSASEADVTAIGPSMERSRSLVVMVAVVGALLLVWSIVTSAGDGSTESVGSTTTEATGSSSTMTVSVTTTEAVVVRSTTSASQGSGYVNGFSGPVLGAGVEGTVFGINSTRLTKMDLASGEVTSIMLGTRIEGEHLRIGIDEVLLFDGRFLHTVGLTTGAHDTVRIDEPFGEYAWNAGTAGPVSIWLVTEDESSASSRVSQVGFTGEVLQSFEFEAPFRVQSANGTDIYLEGPGGSWIFDTVTSSVTALKGQLIHTNSDALVLLSCNSPLECEVSIDTGEGLVRTSALTAADVSQGGMHISPDHTGVFIHRYVENHAEFTYVDLGTGNRIEFGELPIEAYEGILWLPDTPWIIAKGDSPVDLMAVNTNTGDVFELELSGRGGGLGGSHLGLIPAS